MNSIIEAYKRSLEVLKKKPILLWGLSLMSGLLIILAKLFGFIPLISLPIVFTLEASMAVLYLKGLRGNEVKSEDLFSGFKSFAHVAGGMAWMSLWILIWALIPIVGFVFAVIKAYEYSFTPYILMTKPEISATEALKESKKMTLGRKGKMFWANVLIGLAFGVCCFVIGLFAAIPYIGVLFGIILFLVIVAYAAFAPIFLGLVNASFYDDAVKSSAAPAAPVAPAAPEAPAAPSNPEN